MDIILVGQLFSRIRADVSDDLERLNELWGQVDSFFAALSKDKIQSEFRRRKRLLQSLCVCRQEESPDRKFP